MVLSLRTKTYVHFLQGNPSSFPSKLADCYFTHNSNRPAMVLYPPFQLLSLDPAVRIKPSLSCIIKSQIPLSNLNFVAKGRVMAWKWFTFCASMFAINKMGWEALQLSYFKFWKMMLWKHCTQYASKFGKLSSGHRTGKGQFSFQSQRKAMPQNAQTTAQLHSSHMLVKWCSKFSKPGFSNMWTSRCSSWS